MRVKFTFHSFAVLRRIHSIRRSMAKLVARRFHDFDASGYGSATLAGLLDRLQSCTSLCPWSTSRPPLVTSSGENGVLSGSVSTRFSLPEWHCITVPVCRAHCGRWCDSRWRLRSSNTSFHDRSTRLLAIVRFQSRRNESGTVCHFSSSSFHRCRWLKTELFTRSWPAAAELK